MALTTNKTIYLNGASKDGEKILANFNASLSENGQLSINETVMDQNSIDKVEQDFTEFRELAKATLDSIKGSEVDG